MEKIPPFSQTFESKLTAHRRTKTMAISDSKKNNFNENQSGMITQNQSQNQ